ncbi:DUF7668 domain-containing protein [Agrococcus sp. KRD186]|jgi:hypothetical protein|uniref:DUF7668 domain-containing protein n=1 Tax=Agrococcus sp. KRD186 TaxID=2729730 RepID=UPI0019D114A2|nr:hypothetical protein [Agrococcus sp. KRD186]
MTEQPSAEESIAIARRQQLVLRVAATLLAHHEVDLLARRHSALSADELRRELDAAGETLVAMPNDAWQQFASQLELHPVPDADPPALQAWVPLWTAHGPAGRSALVRLTLEPGDDLEHYEVIGFAAAPPPPAEH